MTESGRYIIESTVMDKSSWDTPRKRPVSLNGCVFQSPISHFDTLSPFQCCNHVSTEHISTLKRRRGGFGYRQKRCFLKLRKDAQAFVLLKCVNTFVHDCRSVRSFTSWLTRPRLSMLQSVCRFNQANILCISNLIVIYSHSLPQPWITLDQTQLMLKDLDRTDKALFTGIVTGNDRQLYLQSLWQSFALKLCVHINWLLSYLIFGSLQLTLLTPH